MHNTGTIFSLGIQGNFFGILGNQDDYCVVPSWKYKCLATARSPPFGQSYWNQTSLRTRDCPYILNKVVEWFFRIQYQWEEGDWGHWKIHDTHLQLRPWLISWGKFCLEINIHLSEIFPKPNNGSDRQATCQWKNVRRRGPLYIQYSCYILRGFSWLPWVRYCCKILRQPKCTLKKNIY